MDRGRNLGVLAEDSEEEEVDDERKKEGSSDESESDDDEPDPSARREPNKFDNLCDGVTNTMAYVHGAMQELLNMKDEMLKHSLPPTLLIKLATVTGKVFRSVSDLNMPVNELVRLVRVYSTPWEEKSAALKKLHEDYENKQRQLNIAVKRLQLVDAHSKRIAREKRIMNWEKLFAKIMSNKGHGRRWKFLIETIKQKAKLGLEHVQEYTRALEESSDEEEDEEDDMPMTIKRPGEDSDKLSDLEEGEEDDEKTSTAKDESSEETEKSEKEEEDSTRLGSPKKVRFASPEEPAPPVYVKPPSSDVTVWTGEPEYDHFLYCRVYQPSKVEDRELKCVITLGDQIKKTKRIDVERPVSQPQPEKEEPKPKGRGLIGMRAKPAEDKMAQFKKEAEQRKAEQEAKTSDQDESGTNAGKKAVDKNVDVAEEKSDVKGVEGGEKVENPEIIITVQSPDAPENNTDLKSETNTEKGENSESVIDGDVINPDDVAEQTNDVEHIDDTEKSEEKIVTKDKEEETDDPNSKQTPDTSNKGNKPKEPPKRRFTKDLKKSSESDSKKMARSLLMQKKKNVTVKQKEAVKSDSKKPGIQEDSKKRDVQDEERPAEEFEEYQEIFFEIPEYFGNDSVWRKGKENEPKTLKLSVHKGPLEEMFAMATIDLDDIFDQEMKTVFLPEPHGDDDVPLPPGERDKVEDELNLQLPTPKTENGAPVEKHEILKKLEPLHFPIFALNPKKTDNVHEPCGNVPIIFYLAKQARPKVWNRNNGTVPFNDFILDIAGIDLQTWRKEDFFKETESRAASAMEWQPEVQVKVVEKEVIKEVIVEAEPKIVEVPKTPPPPEPEPPKEEVVSKAEYDKLIDKHSEELQLVQVEYEKRLQELLENLQQMQQTQLEQKELLLQQQQQQQNRPPLVHQRPVSSSSKRSSASGGRTSAVPPKTPSQLQPSTMVSPSLGVSQDMLPKTPGTYDTLTPIGFESRTENQSVDQSVNEPPSFPRKNFRIGRPLPSWGTGVPEDFMSRLAWFEESSKKHQQENQEKTMKTIQEELEKKLAGQNKLSRKEEGLYDAMRDVSLPALFMPTKTNNATIYNPRAHQYFHPTGSSDLRLSQPPSVFQLPPLPQKSRMSVVNLFELSRNFNRKEQAWLMDKYIQQQEPLQNVHGTVPQTPAPTLTQTPYNDNQQSVRDVVSANERETEM
ncbi:AT-rich interactive domain-containing protein 4B-like isoform X2 [Ostrea edulis]|uniref:AT-rich interactive domain-containing protein 4B-like isoform X2 n=1 Tax=Ostrea edulis TaxID=37623 RepID=UPI0024AFB19A|nr:AT-rich interactive domain-containing protein 4B-like isoform X2 [Ostrea edulis]